MGPHRAASDGAHHDLSPHLLWSVRIRPRIRTLFHLDSSKVTTIRKYLNSLRVLPPPHIKKPTAEKTPFEGEATTVQRTRVRLRPPGLPYYYSSS